jgi:hypothetical protein
LVNLNAADVLNIYYDPRVVANAYLDDQIWHLGGGGILAPVAEATAPEPGSTVTLLPIGDWIRSGAAAVRYTPRPAFEVK